MAVSGEALMIKLSEKDAPKNRAKEVQVVILRFPRDSFLPYGG